MAVAEGEDGSGVDGAGCGGVDGGLPWAWCVLVFEGVEYWNTDLGRRLKLVRCMVCFANMTLLRHGLEAMRGQCWLVRDVSSFSS
jgi:hypothetical protein